MNDGDDIAELALEGGVKVGAALDGGETVAVCEFGEYADVAVIFELDAWGGSGRAGVHGGDIRVAIWLSVMV